MTTTAPLLTIKTPEQVRASIARRDHALNRGFLYNRAQAGLTALAAATALPAPIVAFGVTGVLVADFVTYVARRATWLRRYEAGRPRLVTPQDFEAVGHAWTAAGIPEPTMSDYEREAGLADRTWSHALRYGFLKAQYRGGTVVDIGGGDGRLCWRYNVCAPEDYIGVDPSRHMIAMLLNKTDNRARGVVAVAEDTKLPDACADLVACSECFEHLPDPGAALAEFARILKPGGTIVIQSPSAYQLRNLNPFHVAQTWLGRLLPGVLQRMVVHENTFLEAYTYHWDFTRHDFRRYMRGLPLRLEAMTTATYRFNPAGSRLHRIAARVAQWPVVRGIWWDMTVVLRKDGARRTIGR